MGCLEIAVDARLGVDEEAAVRALEPYGALLGGRHDEARTAVGPLDRVAGARERGHQALTVPGFLASVRVMPILARATVLQASVALRPV
jgi:hypothetical protein